MDGRVRRGPRRLLITDEHEAEAMAALRRTHHSRAVRFLLELVGWPVAPLRNDRRVTTSSNGSAHADGAEHFLDPVCGTCGARHRR